MTECSCPIRILIQWIQISVSLIKCCRLLKNFHWILIWSRTRTFCIRIIHLISTCTFFFYLKEVIHVWKRQDSLRKEIEVLPLLREAGARGDVEFNRIISLLLFRTPWGDSIDSIGWGRPVASNWAMRLIELRGRLRDPRSRLLKSGDGERGFAFTRKNLCHSFNGAAHWHPAFPRDCNVRFDSLRRRINFILRLSSCTRALRRFSPEECSREAQLSKKVWTLLIAE